MMSRRKPLAAAVAVTAALVLAAPVASAGTAKTAPAKSTKTAPTARQSPFPFPLPGGGGICGLLVGQLAFANFIGNPILVNLLGLVQQVQGCSGAAS